MVSGYIFTPSNKQKQTKMKKTLTVSNRFELTTTSKGRIFAEVGDKLTVKDKGGQHYTILKLNDTMIFSRWMRIRWIDSHCN